MVDKNLLGDSQETYKQVWRVQKEKQEKWIQAKLQNTMNARTRSCIFPVNKVGQATDDVQKYKSGCWCLCLERYPLEKKFESEGTSLNLKKKQQKNHASDKLIEQCLICPGLRLLTTYYSV